MLISSKSRSTGEIPKAWKKADVMLVFKNSKCGKMGGYKSISLTLVFVKTAELKCARGREMQLLKGCSQMN